MPTAHQLQAQIIYRAKKVLEFGPITPAHRKPPWPGYKQRMRFFTKLLAEHPLVVQGGHSLHNLLYHIQEI